MRSVPAPVRDDVDGWESDEWTFPVLATDWDEIAGGDGEDEDEDASAWHEVAECVEDEDEFPYGALLAPERADTLDFTFTGVTPAVGPHSLTPSPTRRGGPWSAHAVVSREERGKPAGRFTSDGIPSHTGEGWRFSAGVGSVASSTGRGRARAALRQSVDYSAPRQVVASRAPKQPSGRVAQASVRLAEIGKIRPVVHIPGRAAKTANGQSERAHKETRLPPVWLLANLFILLIAIVAVLPRVVQVDAAAGCQWYTIRPGDTLGNLGWAHHTSALARAKANQIANPNMIYVGQRLCIPLTQNAHTTTPPKVPATTQPPRFGSATGVQSFVQLALPYARQAHNATGWPTSMILAQWGLEQGWRAPGYTGFNWGNVAALPGEPTVNGIAVPGSPAAFAYAKSPDQGLSYYIRVAHLSFYNGVGQAAQNGPDAAARALGQSPWDAGHYTATGSPGSSLLSLMRVYNLYYYDSH